MRALEKIYLEITNVCNLSCPFCPPTKRAGRTMSVGDFSRILSRIRARAKTLYFHVKGEPLTHPDLSSLIDIAAGSSFSVIITTNGTLLPESLGSLSLKANLARVNVSLQSLAQFPPERRLPLARAIFEAADRLVAANRSVNPRFLVSFRLWTRDQASETAEILEELARRYGIGRGGIDAVLSGQNGLRLAPGVALHAADTFDWPALDGEDYGPRGFCRGLRDQAAILADGTVVPCCLDGEGIIALGNVLETEWDEIMASPRARALYDGFSARTVAEPLCRRCGYRLRFGA
ncbi:MAG TPA: radical SAM/SPASM domain-containing protein [Treponemataceae bacterium]|nr:radical SAM/SPASM domain-containing protein [Treponemataceae bacterium]